MRLAAYLSTSRHEVFYFRWPIPASLHPEGRRSDLKLSLGTRSIRVAQHISRSLAAAGHSLLSTATVRHMKYGEIREHVREHLRFVLARFKERVDENGPLDEVGLAAFKNARDFAEGDAETWLELLHPEGEVGLLTRFCRQQNLPLDDLSADDRKHILAELQKGHRAYAEAAPEHNASLARIDLWTAPKQPAAPPRNAPEAGPGYREVVERYFAEAAGLATGGCT